MRTVLVPLAAVIVLVGCLQPGPAGTPESPGHTMEEAVEVATEYIRAAPTFAWDGMEETLEVTGVETMRCPYCWEVSLAFDCRHGGYGDRTGMMVTQAITHHTARVLVREGEVEYAVLDGRWDEMNQKPYQGMY
ncbi:MAG: hypothetical protein GXO65_07200 [Euryarchaeota archaeon]|nr:hypothetical protein [Euryarchaeota archaeon]